ncbi:MAG TPA: glycosyltransferase family 2 protein [Opitutaceae bacterium]
MRPLLRLSDLPPPPPGRTGWPWDVAPQPPASGNLPRITLVTPSFRQAAFLEETLRSVLLQGYPNLHYIVVDGGSDDGSVDILRKYAPWLDFWVSEPDRGQSHAINKGLARAEGVWFNWLNSDDCLVPGALHAVAAAGTSDGTLLVAGELQLGPALAQPQTIRRVELTADLEHSLTYHCICQPATFLRTALVRELGGVDESLHFTMDLALWLRALSQHGGASVVKIPQPLAFFREHAGAKTARHMARFAEDERRLFRTLAEAASLPPAVLDTIAPAAAAVPAWPIPALNVARLREVLVQRFVWSEQVESAWHRRDYVGFRRALRLFRDVRIAPLTRRQLTLSALALLPDAVLQLMERKRTPSSPALGSSS